MKNYDNYFRRLKGEEVPNYDAEPDPGFYRKRDKDRSGKITWQPVAYFYKDDILHCVMSNNLLSEQYGLEMWTHCCDHPITEAEYRRVADDGLPWSDQDATVQAQQSDAGAPEEGYKAKLERQIKEAEEGAKKYEAIDSDTLAAQAQDARDNLNKLSKRADNIRKVELDPHQAEVDKINAKWQPLVKSSKAAADTLRSKMEDWERTKREQAQIAEDKYQRAADRAIASGRDLPPPPSESNAPAPAAQIKGASGRAANVSTIKIAVIDDIAKVFDYFKGHAEVVEILQKLANKAVQAGITVPGTSVKDDVKIK